MRNMYMAAILFALMVQPVALLPGAESGIWFQENFRNYSYEAPACSDNLGIKIGNDPVWTQTAEANCRMKEAGFIFKEFAPYAKTGTDPKNYDVLFKFRLQSEKDAKFQVHLRNDVKGRNGDIVIEISSTEVIISSEGIDPAVSAKVKIPTEIARNAWHVCAVTVKDGSLAVFIDEQRGLKQVATAKIPVLPGKGINFYGFKDTPFSISDIVVREPSALPDNRITNLMPAARKIDAASFKPGISQNVQANDVFGATVRTGLDKDAVKMNINWGDGKKNELSFGVAGIPSVRKVMKDGKSVMEKYELSDAVIQIKGIGEHPLNYHVRPMLRRYKASYEGSEGVLTDTCRDIIRDWDLLPKASEHPLKVECRRTDKGIDIYLDSCYAGSLEGSAIKDLAFSLSPSASIGPAFSLKTNYESLKYLPLDIAALGMAKAFSEAKPSVEPGLSEVKGIPIFVASGAGSADIGLAREGQGNWGLEVDEYLARSPFDGLLTEIHFTVPGKAMYSKAWVLCAVDPDPAKVPALTARIAHYVENGCGANQLADTVLTLPRNGEKPADGIVQVGTVNIKGKDAKNIEVPLYLVEIPLRSGEIIDLLMGKPRMNFEFFGKPWENFEQLDNSCKPDPKSTSAVQIFGVTLEKLPVGMQVVQSQPANIFHNDEKPETGVVLKSFAAAGGKLVWDILDVEGRKAGGGSVGYKFSRAGEEQKVSIPLKMPELGWYELRISMQDDTGRTMFVHPASFALLGVDGRKAGYESPYGTWWFDGTHNTPKEIDFAGPIMFKAGIRKAAWTGQSEKAMEKWSITKDQINMPFKFDDLKKPENAVQKGELAIRKELEKYPHAREVVIFHESGPGNDIPVELIGLKPEMTEAQTANQKRYADLLNFAGAFFREKFPQLKTVVGNNSCSQSTIAAILRNGGKPEYIDYIGIEAPSQVFIPEKLQEWAIQGHHMAKDTAKILSGKDIPATGCYEFTYRSERDTGEQQQAEWYARDILISLSNNFTRIGTGILFDTSNAYYNGLWGASGILRRSPYGYPKKAYVAYAVLTNVFDQVKFRRQIPTGSTTAYAVEFDRADRKFASALWASRGDAEFSMEFAVDTPVRIVDMYGRSSEQKTSGGKLIVKAGTSPAYLVADKEIKGITLGKRSFPKDEKRAKSATVAAVLDKVDSVSLDKNNSLDTPKVAPLQTPIRQLGEFELRQAKDEQKGDCIELELKTDKNKDLSKYITEYTSIRLKTPASINGNPVALGVWVKGNSNWGRVMFEIEDADGETWRSIGTGGWGCDVLDWPGNISVNFDGWCFVALPFRDTKLFNDHSPGPVLEQWVSGGGNKKIDLPIKVKALIVEMNRRPLDLIDFKEASPSIRIKDISGIEEK
ncbi:MAG TPA: hypothetical protein DET40_06980 [Lentisphaeria bacterium]|nr:MAG: hypothetical protein A2X45_07320 [Lentisphaerae bacterium GWF2_50_93]HCE43274.1 hypothetical protein [Lentisphaeria bacterium]